MNEVANRTRANRAYGVLIIHASMVGESYSVQHSEQHVADLLTDMMHNCALIGSDFDEALELARKHFAEETL